MAIVDLGTQDGMAPGMAFEVCRVHQVGSFTSLTRVCDASVQEVSEKTALLAIGEYQKNKFHQKDDKAREVRAGFVIREKRLD